METIAFCEYEEHARKILNKHWPDVPIHKDVRLLDGKQYRGAVDVVCGGFPCQDLSQAGRQEGIEGERSGLYTEMLRIISDCRPRYGIFENVTGLLSGESGRWFAKFLYDLAEIGYDAEWHCISASFIGAPHHRDRVWIIAYPNNDRKSDIWKRRKTHNELRNGEKEKQGRHTVKHGINGNIETQISSYSNTKRRQRFPEVAYHLKQQIEFMRSTETERERFNLSESPLCGADDGVPRRLDRLRRLGNAVVPQIPEAIGRAIISTYGS